MRVLTYLALCGLASAAQAQKAASGSAAKPAPASPKISSVSPSTLVDEGQTSVTLLLRGENLVGTNPVVTLESKTLQGVRPCSTTSITNERELVCTISGTLSDLFPTGIPVSFSIALKQAGKVVVSDVSSATFTLVAPILATELCIADAGDADVQIQLRGNGFGEAAAVHFATANTTTTCMNLQVFGTSDLVCYLPKHAFGALGGARVRVLRVGERGAANSKNSRTRGPADQKRCERLR